MKIVLRLSVIIGVLVLLSLVLPESSPGEKQGFFAAEQPAWAAVARAKPKRADPPAGPVLEIPKLKMKARVVEGVTWEILGHGPGHFPGTAGPGEIGNYAIAGHRNVAGNWFMDLPRLQPGDEVLVHSGSKVYRYRICEVLVVLPNEMWIIDPIPGRAIITLVTCIPVPKPSYRFVAVGELEGSRTAGAGSVPAPLTVSNDPRISRSN